PEAERTRHLTRVGYPHSAALLGELKTIDKQGQSYTLALLHARVPNQGDAWSWTNEFLKRSLESATLTGETAGDYQDDLTAYTAVAAIIGRRLAQQIGRAACRATG